MLNITFEFVGGPHDGKIVVGRLGEPSDAERHYLFSHHGRLGQRFSIASDYAIDKLAEDSVTPDYTVPRHYYVVTERLEDGGDVWVQATYSPLKSETAASQSPRESAADLDETEDYIEEAPAVYDDGYGDDDDDEAEDLYDEVDSEVDDDFEDFEEEDDLDEAAVSGEKNALDGYLLIAAPRMRDEWFAQTVVLVLEQNGDETFGVILNRPTKETVGDLWSEVGTIPCASDAPVFAGGPASGPVLVLHQDEESADVPILPKVYLSVEKEHLEELVREEDRPQRLFVGTAGWTEGQLEREIAHGDWLLLPATDELIFASPEEQWQLAMRQFGAEFYHSIGVKHIPHDVRTN